MTSVLVPGVCVDHATLTLYVDPPRACESLGLEYEPCDHAEVAAWILGVLQRDFGYPAMQLQVCSEGEPSYIQPFAQGDGGKPR